MPSSGACFFNILHRNELFYLLDHANGEDLYNRWRGVDRKTKVQAELRLLSSQKEESLPFQKSLLHALAINPSFANTYPSYVKAWYVNNLSILLRIATNLSLTDRIHGLLIIQALSHQPYIISNRLYDS